MGSRAHHTDANEMNKRSCIYAVRQPDKPAFRMEETAPLVEAALVTTLEGEVQPALILKDGKALVLSVEQICVLHKLFKDWASLFAGNAPVDEPYTADMVTPT